MATSRPHLPAVEPQTSYSFYPYPLTSIPSTSTSLRGLAPPPTAQAGPSRDRDRRADIQHHEGVRRRAELRALAGFRPAGFAVGRDSEDLENEEMALDDERQHTNAFGHRFLLPFGRRQTQMELDAARSATPEDPDNERRQEDRLVGESPTPRVGGQGVQGTEEEGEEEAGAVDLDDDVEDLDEQEEDEGEDDAMEEE